MTLNSYFLQGSATEQGLIQDLINEQLKIYGVEVYYIPRIYATENTVMREVIESQFNDAYPIEAYVETYQGYDGAGDVFTKFGLSIQDDLTLTISRERYENYIKPLIENKSNVKLASRPKEGDLIYFPLGDRLFEIKFVEHEDPFYQLQKNYVYELKCELFRYEDETINTGVDEIDDEIKEVGYIERLTMVSSGTTATAVSTFINGGVQYITMTDGGYGYAQPPTVTFSSPGSGTTATGFAILDGGSVDAVRITNPGSGYTFSPAIKFSAINDIGVGAGATVGIATTGTVGVVTVTSGGTNYGFTPTVTFSNPKHVGAAATAVLDSPLVSTGVSVTSAPISTGASSYLFPGGTTGGVFYATPPTVTFSLPTGTGNAAEAVATLADYSTTGGRINTLGLTTGGKFYTSAPTVTIAHPGTVAAAATIGIAGSSINPSSVAFSTTGRAYTSAATVAITTTSGQDAPLQVAVGIATINTITGIVTAVGFNSTTDAWCVGSAATIGSGYTAAPAISFSGGPSPVRATATVTVSAAGTVSSISIGNSGFGYVSVPTVTIAAPGGANEAFRALGIATLRTASIRTTGTIGIGSTNITGITTTNIIVGDRVRLGIGYSDTYNFIPNDTFVTSIGSSTVFVNNAATNVGIATSVFEFGIDQCGIVTGIAVTFGGGGYLEPPTVSISNTVGEKNYITQVAGVSAATGIATMNTAGVVTSIHITNAGNSYILPPEITLQGPTTASGGTYVYNETLTGGSSGVTANVKDWDATTGILKVGISTGIFTIGESITGGTSGAVYVLKSKTADDQDVDDVFAQNLTIESAADGILDFTERNPFGEI